MGIQETGLGQPAIFQKSPRVEESGFLDGFKELFVFDLGMDYFSDQQSNDDAAD